MLGRSLTVRLLVGLIAPLIAAAVLIGLGGAWATKSIVDYTSDRLLAGSLRAIAETVTVHDGRVSVDLPPWSLGLLDSPERDSVFYSVRQGNRLLTGYGDLPAEPAFANHAQPLSFRTVSYMGRPVRQAIESRWYAGASDPVAISVAQTLDSRDAVRAKLMTSVGVMEAGLVLLAALLIWPAARWSLRPLDGVRRELVERAADADFAPVGASDVPPELKPVVGAFNALLTQLDRSVAGVRQFTADASHQMRTPLAILKTHLSLLRRGRLAAAQRGSVDDALEAVDRLQRLIEQLLALARADVIAESPNDPCALIDVVEARRSDWERRAGAGGAQLRIRMPAPFPGVRLSAPLVEQVLENLIDNAIRYGGKSIDLAIERTDTTAVIRVSDDGPGVPKMIADRAFDRFIRSSEDTTGSGLGLSIVRALAERSGGSARIRQRTQEAWFALEVTLPLVS
jgi:two-component system sensor histidine kinase TctE